MKKIILGLCALTLLIIACQDDSNDSFIQEDFSQIEVDMSDFYVHTDSPILKSSQGANADKCHSMQVLNRQLKENPGLEHKMYNIEKHTRQVIAFKGKPTKPGGGNGGGGGDTDVDVLPINDGLGIINIPVYVHVVYSNSNENISNAQISSQINVLNDDFRKLNNDLNLPAGSTFENDATDSEITFSLAGTFRHSDSRTSWGTNNAVKSAYPPVSPSTHLNIWVCNIGGGILGYAQFPEET